MGIMSSIYNSDFNIEQLFLGSEEITEMYLGDQLVFSKITNNLFYKLHEFVGSLTVRNTVEAPVKSAILKGQTLVDCKGNQKTNYKVDDLGYYTITGSGTYQTAIYDQSMLKPNTTYTLLTFIEQNTLNGEFRVHVPHTTSSLQMSTYANVPLNGVGLFKHILTTPTDLSLYEVGMRTSVMATATDGVIKFRHLLIEGDYIDIDIPFFTGMVSVKMPVLTTSNCPCVFGKGGRL